MCWAVWEFESFYAKKHEKPHILAFNLSLPDNVAPDCLFKNLCENTIVRECDGRHIFVDVASVMMRSVGRQTHFMSLLFDIHLLIDRSILEQ